MADDPALSSAQNDAVGQLTGYLKGFKLDTPEMVQFVRSAITNSWSSERVKLEIPNQPAFQQAFPEYKARIDAGLAPMSPLDIINYRSTATKLMQDAGLPAGFYDQNEDFVNLVTKDISPQELQTRIQDGYAKVQQAPPEVRNAFGEYFGVNGDNMLATFFLDPSKGVDTINRKLTEAQIGGAGSQYGFNVGLGQAEQYAQQGITAQSARQGFQQAYGMKPLAEETISEAGDLSNEDIAKGVLTGGDAEAQVKRRQAERSAQFRQAYGGAGGATQGQSGLGAGKAV